jgi:ATP-dependent helicase Lhr and Lhr-like helicase
MIYYQEEKHSNEEIFSKLNPIISEWFKKKFKVFTEPQKYSILNIHEGKNTFISAETGTGKTLSAFTAIINELFTLSENDLLEDRVYCIYVSPLKALNNDIERNLNEPLEEIKKIAEKQNKKIDIRVGVRTGDTTTSERAKMLRKAPHILITTPESLAILLNSPKFIEKMSKTKWLIIDEIHSLAENKRGTHLSLSMERLQNHTKELCRIGLSATVAPIEEMAKFLVGFENGKERSCAIVNVSFIKKMDLQVISPLPNLINNTQEQIQKALYETIDKLISSHKTTLIFTNTRAATERVVHHLKDKFPGKYLEGNIGAHHSSLSREHRLNIENRLKQGKLKAVVCSTSLELGIDIGDIDLVILLGSPKSVARAIQRMGRSGHRLHEKVKGRIIVLDRDDLVECAVLLRNALNKKIDKIKIPKNALDVLSQHIYGIAIEKPTLINEVFKLVKNSYSFHELSRKDFDDIIDYLSGKYSSLENRHVYAKIWYDEETETIGKKGKLARVLYMTNIGTIPDESKITVKIGTIKLGYLDEIFLERMVPGDVFVLGGETYIFKYTRGMTLQVATAGKRPPTVPSWVSETLPLSFDLAKSIQDFRALMEEKFVFRVEEKEIEKFLLKYLSIDERAAKAIHNYFKEQYLFAEIPHIRKLLIENYKDGNKKYMIFHSLFGRKVNDALSRAIAYMIGYNTRKDVEVYINDNGFILSSEKIPIQQVLNKLDERSLEIALKRGIEKGEIFKRRFRHVATRSLMILRNYKGRTKSVGKQQMATHFLIPAIREIDDNFPIFKETRREIMEDAMDLENAKKVIEMINKKEIKIKEIQTTTPSPFAFNLIAQGISEVMKMEERIEFVKRLHEKVIESIEKKEN